MYCTYYVTVCWEKFKKNCKTFQLYLSRVKEHASGIQYVFRMIVKAKNPPRKANLVRTTPTQVKSCWKVLQSYSKFYQLTLVWDNFISSLLVKFCPQYLLIFVRFDVFWQIVLKAQLFGQIQGQIFYLVTDRMQVRSEDLQWHPDFQSNLIQVVKLHQIECH